MAWEFKLLHGPLGGVTEGPAWDGKTLLYTHIPASRIYRYSPDTGASTVYREGTECANGLMFDANGNLYACEGDARRVVRYEPNGDVKILRDHFNGKQFNIPNDLAIDPDGRIWFTDPFYEGAAGSWSEDRSNKELDHDSVYRLAPCEVGQWEVTRVTFDTTRPNGVLFSLDYQVLYVAQSGRDHDEKRQLRGYQVCLDGSLGTMEVLHDFGTDRGIDGMCLDTEGNIIATAGWELGGPGPMIYVFSPSGEVLETHPIQAKRPTNCSFGGVGLSTLYVTSTEGHLFCAQTERRGRLWYPAT